MTVESFVGQSRGRGRAVSRSSWEKVLRGLTDGLSECDARRNGDDGATGGHCGQNLRRSPQE